VSDSFPQFSIADNNLSFVPIFKYRGHIIDYNELQDDAKCLQRTEMSVYTY